MYFYISIRMWINDGRSIKKLNTFLELVWYILAGESVRSFYYTQLQVWQTSRGGGKKKTFATRITFA